jgi:hypothetical protein
VLGYLRNGIRTHPFNFFTLVIALSAAAFAGWSAYEAHELRRDAEGAALDSQRAASIQAHSVDQSRIAAERSAAAAERTAAAFEKTVLTGERGAKAAEENASAAENSERALLEVAPRLTQANDIEFIITNIGRTPALDVKAAAEATVAEDEQDNQLAEKMPSAGDDLVIHSLAPGAQTKFTAVLRDEVSKLRRRLRSEYSIYVLGIVTYSDVFAKERGREVCYSLLSSSSTELMPCEQFNTEY